MPESLWISVKEAAAMLGYSRDYFRRIYCDPAAPLVPIRPGRRAGSRTLVLRAAIVQLVETETRRPAS